MELNETRYWQALRELLDRAVADEAAELAAAERMLAETAPEPSSHFSDERIAEVVRLVTAADTAVAMANAPDDVFDDVLRSAPPAAHAPALVTARAPDPAPAPALVRTAAPLAAPVVAIASARPTIRQRLAKLPRPLAAAAMLMLAPQFLAAMGILGVVVVVATQLTFTTNTLPFQSAIQMMSDPEQAEEARISSQHVVVGHVLDAIALIQDVSKEASELGSAATQALTDLRDTFNGRATPPQSGNGSLHHLSDQLSDTGLDIAIRTHALSELRTEVAHGIGALRAVGATAGLSPRLTTHITALLGVVGEHLQR